jgi:DNA-binding NtrC family response regulator
MVHGFGVRTGDRPSDGRETTASATIEPVHAKLSESSVLALVIAWHPNDASRVGDLAIVPSDESTVILGRGASDSEPRMRFFRPRPGRLEPAPPLGSPALSRRQLQVTSRPPALEVRSLGRSPMRLNGTRCDAGIVHPGDTLAFGQELVLLCLQRPACPAPLRYWDAPSSGDFGSPDAVGILGESPAAWRLRDEIAFAAKSAQHVLLVGQTGAGKELAARAVHALSSRANRPLVARNAATLPPGIIDAEVFGNVKNYPNPGMADRPGLIGQANGGFLFLDELGELPVELQSHLLRVLDSGGEYQRLGEATVSHSDFRLLAATNRDPDELRHDLTARLTVRIALPSLSDRREDIPLLARHLVARAAEKSPEIVGRFIEESDGRTSVKFDAKFVAALLQRDYPGNARDLQALLWKAMAASDGDYIAPAASVAFTGESKAEMDAPRGPAAPRDRTTVPPTEQEIRSALEREGGSVTHAARALGLSSRYALYRIMMKLGITASD